MNFFDLLVVAAAATFGWIGYRRGFLARVFSWAGLALGVVVAFAFADDVVTRLHSDSPRVRLLAGLAFVVVAMAVGQGLGHAAARGVTRLAGRHLGPAVWRADQIAGAVAGTLVVVMLLWLLIPALASAPGWPAVAVRQSAIARFVARRVPDPPSAAAALGRLMGEEAAPEVFDSLIVPDVGNPPRLQLDDDVIERVSTSVVKVIALACGQVDEGSGYFAGESLVVTNAHVVAGATTINVQTTDGFVYEGRVVAFDPDRDLAVLRVTTTRPPLASDRAAPPDLGAVFGYPENGPLRAAPMRIAQRIDALGTNIERTKRSHRDVYVLAAATKPGDSGGPVVNRRGAVVGVLFARDVGRATIAYAVTNKEVDAVLRPVVNAGLTAPVDPGPCLVN